MTTNKLMKTYAPLPVTFTHGNGCWLWDNKDNKYLDALCGIAVTGLGHAHPAISEAICGQAKRLLHTSNLFEIELQKQLAEKLTALAGMDNVFFSNSGAEANEAAIKIARLYGHHKGIKQPTIIVTENSFHGRTLATLTATGNRKVQAGFEPLVAGFSRAPYNDIDALRNIAKHDKNVVAVMVEPLQGESGINIPDDSYLPAIREICDKQGWLMILDEIQTGMGRSGRWFAFQHHGITPDIMTLAKALGNGVPIGACLAKGEAAQTFQPGNHGTTFGGNPLACRTALAVIETIEQNGLVERANVLGKRILEGLRQNLAMNPHVKDIRGKGLLIAVELNAPCKALAQQALDMGIVINVANENRIRLLPPLILSDDEADLIVDKVSSLVSEFKPK
ncbi:MAG: acetylornithine aminotransferase [Gammaproteobacteria bacterium SG8_15]|nr:MAG: acetylornithine aminotransferase [Gammaproteobacteria bacterium SG8_15]